MSHQDKVSSTWTSSRLSTEVQLVRWGSVGVPVLLFPTAGGDAEECERFLMIQVLAPLIDAHRVKIYSVDSVAGRTWLTGNHSPEHRTWVQHQFDAFIVSEIVPAIRKDCRSDDIEIVTAGASIGAFNALASICRHPEIFRAAICMSGTYDLSKYLGGRRIDAFESCSPVHFVPKLRDDEVLEPLRRRFVLLAHGEGKWESPEESWRVADVLGARGIPNRVDSWGTEWDHDWPTWRNMLPKYVDEVVPATSPEPTS